MKRRGLALVIGMFSAACLHAEEIALYPTGPSEDSAFLRFFNSTDTPLQLSAANGASLSLAGEQRASDFLTVPAAKPITGSLKQNGQQQALAISVAPGEFATVVALADEQGLRYVTLREQPDDFNGLKASLAIYNLAGSCAAAGIQAAGRKVDIFKDVPEGSVQRRSINPLALAVQLTCAGAAQGPVVELGQLAAGQRYSLFLVPTAQGPRLLPTQDNLAN
ncbi:alginate O-acetyltransferase AlgF [Pseudomonas sp. 5P_3.1_Bac2]|uniref:alginate O-acetyltransferase AlgF n=1 Tax=Pseudomonas sp. 5P_3.1_Bac2 TaxID=2971617 RepID=UPI0021C78C91|nr:alginate O-acetyltransferase AlgF [Pseudomonas sp. 5P_3.1_Bac2]MCU1717238.1 alginate O-acetyltransferase AlgF [Pseudomonas sp. 5P_3.1_Bac2]